MSDKLKIDKSDKSKYKLPFFDLKKLQNLDNIRCMILGRTGCGKSYLLNYLLNDVIGADNENQVILFCSTTYSESNTFYLKIKNRFPEFRPNVLLNLIEYQKQKLKEGKELNDYYVIIDDVVEMGHVKLFNDVFRTCRHVKINIFFLLQHPSLLKSNIARANTNLIFIFNESNEDTIDIYHKAFGSRLNGEIIRKRDFENILSVNLETDSYSFLCLILGKSGNMVYTRSKVMNITK